MRRLCEERGQLPLAGRLLRNRSAELQRLISFLAATAHEQDHGAEKGNNGDFLATHDSTSN